MKKRDARVHASISMAPYARVKIVQRIAVQCNMRTKVQNEISKTVSKRHTKKLVSSYLGYSNYVNLLVSEKRMTNLLGPSTCRRYLSET